jgi:hypothetical protein
VAAPLGSCLPGRAPSYVPTRCRRLCRHSRRWLLPPRGRALCDFKPELLNSISTILPTPRRHRLRFVAWDWAGCAGLLLKGASRPTVLGRFPGAPERFGYGRDSPVRAAHPRSPGAVGGRRVTSTARRRDDCVCVCVCVCFLCVSRLCRVFTIYRGGHPTSLYHSIAAAAGCLGMSEAQPPTSHASMSLGGGPRVRAIGSRKEHARHGF